MIDEIERLFQCQPIKREFFRIIFSFYRFTSRCVHNVCIIIHISPYCLIVLKNHHSIRMGNFQLNVTSSNKMNKTKQKKKNYRFSIRKFIGMVSITYVYVKSCENYCVECHYYLQRKEEKRKIKYRKKKK